MISMSARIGLQALAAMVDSWELNERLCNKDLAVKVGCSQKTLTPVLIKLVKADILSSATGGTVRGYRLMNDPRDISVAEIMRVINGRVVFHCCKDLIEINCSRKKEECIIFKTINEKLIAFVKTFEDISLYDFTRCGYAFDE